MLSLDWKSEKVLRGRDTEIQNRGVRQPRVSGADIAGPGIRGHKIYKKKSVGVMRSQKETKSGLGAMSEEKAEGADMDREGGGVWGAGGDAGSLCSPCKSRWI